MARAARSLTKQRPIPGDNDFRYTLKTVQFHAIKALQKDAIEGPQDVIQAITKTLDADREHYILLALNTRSQPVGFKICATGTLSSCQVHPRDVFKAAIALSAAAVILVHNHPSGDLTPSDEDLLLAERMSRAGELLGIHVLDHLIVNAEGEYRSIEPAHHRPRVAKA